MSTKAARGTKRTCQNNECGMRFYDLNRDPITCPICNASYVLASAPLSAAGVFEDKSARKVKKPELVAEDVVDVLPGAEGEEAIADIEADEALPAAEEETFLEEEEDTGDVAAMIDSPVAEGEEEV